MAYKRKPRRYHKKPGPKKGTPRRRYRGRRWKHRSQYVVDKRVNEVGEKLLFGGIVLILLFFVFGKLGPLLAKVLPWVLGIGVLILIIFLVKKIYRHSKNKYDQDVQFRMQSSLTQLQQMDPFEFEHYIGWYFEKFGYSTQVTRAQADNGIDLFVAKDGKKYAVQVKRYSGKNYVGEPEVRNFFGSFADLGVDGGYFVTTSHFSTPAKNWAGARPITLIDGEQLMRSMDQSDLAAHSYYSQRQQ